MDVPSPSAVVFQAEVLLAGTASQLAQRPADDHHPNMEWNSLHPQHPAYQWREPGALPLTSRPVLNVRAGAPPLPTAPITAPTQPAAVAKKKKQSWVLQNGHMHLEDCGEKGKNFVCDVEVDKLESGGKRIKAPCGWTAVYKSEKGATGTSSALDHMRSHGYERDGTKRLQPTMPTNPTGKVSTAHPGSSSAIQWSTQDPRTKELVKDIAKWCVIDGRPAHMVEGEGWKAFCAKRFPEFPGVTDETISARMLEFNDASVQWFTSLLKTVSHVSVTTDGWTSDAKERYRTVTLSFFIPGTWILVCITLGTGICGGKHKQIAEFLMSALLCHQLAVSRVVAVTTNNCKAEIAGVTLAEMFRIACVCHWLNLCMMTVLFEGKPAKPGKPARPASAVSPTFKKLFAIVGKLHNAPLLMDALLALLDEQRHLLNLVQAHARPTKPNNTRWNSACMTAESVLPIRAPLDRLLAIHGADYHLAPLTEEDWIILSQTVAILRPFKTFSVYMEGVLTVLSSTQTDSLSQVRSTKLWADCLGSSMRSHTRYSMSGQPLTHSCATR